MQSQQTQNPPPLTYLDLFSEPIVPPAASRALVPVAPRAPLVADEQVDATVEEPNRAASRLSTLLGSVDMRSVSPREMVGVSLDLYAAGVLTWDEYAMLAFQAELQPGFARTIGALTGEKAEPDKPRDFVTRWEERLIFELRHNSQDNEVIRRTKRILAVLRTLDKPAILAA